MLIVAIESWLQVRDHNMSTMSKYLQNPIFYFTSSGALLLVLLGLVGSCSSKDSYLVWGDAVAGVIGGIVLVSQPPSRRLPIGERKWANLPQSESSCPNITNANNAFSQCLNYQNDKIGSSPGQYLRRYFGLCQFSGLQQAPWWRSFQIIKFPDQTKCEAIRNSVDGLSSTNISANSLVGTSLTVTFGLGPNADEQNILFSQDGYVQYVWSDYPTGFLEPKQGGAIVTFNASNERSIMVQGIQVKNFSPVNSEVNSPIDIYGELQTKATDQVITLFSDKTVASIKTGDRLYERKDAGLDFLSGDNYPLVVKYSGTTPVVLSGAKLRTQYNHKGALGVSTVTEDLRYTDSNCCWPTSGKITTIFNELYILPLVRKRSFNQEVMEFQSGTCGQVILHQTGVDSGDSVEARTVQLYQCF
ncbi:MAG: hypothetical protein NT000_07780 [Proteobacteria bacterium]|nr:hypothetical protein [Pseudomonadota bacterium]